MSSSDSKGCKPAISIVMPVYNAEEYLSESIDSLLRQSFKDFEIICVDDGSTDSSLAMLEAYRSRDSRVRIIRQEHASAAKARNTGLEYIEGKYFTILDADDNFLPDMLQKLYAQIEKVGADICLCAASLFDAKTGESYGRPKWMLNTEYMPGEVFSWRDNSRKFFQICAHFTWNKLYRSAMVKEAGIKFQDSPPNEDAVFSQCTMATAEKITYVDEALLNYRVNNDKSMVAKEGRYPESILMVVKAMRDWLKEKGLYESLKCSFETWMWQWGYYKKLPALRDSLPREKFQNVCEKFNEYMVEFGVPMKKQEIENTCQISVIIPVYNVEKYICQCVDSILNQTFKDIELIIVDDMSTDGSYDKLLSNYGSHPQVHIFRNQNNMGGGATRNAAFKKAKGKYVYFMDSDDVLLDRGLEFMYRIAERYSADIVHLGEVYVSLEEDFELNSDIKVAIRHDAGVPFLHRMSLDIEERLMKHGKYFVQPWTHFYRRSFLLDADIKYPQGIYEDQLFSLMAYAATDRIWSTPGTFYVYRQLENSQVHYKNYTKITRLVSTMVECMRMLQAMPGKAVEPLDEKFMFQIYLKIFGVYFRELITYYDGEDNVPQKIYEAVDKAVKQYFPQDAFFVNLLLHYACTHFQKTKKKEAEVEMLNQKLKDAR